MRMHLEEDALEIRAQMFESGRGTIAGCQQMSTLLVRNRGRGATCFSSHYFVEGGIDSSNLRRRIQQQIASLLSAVRRDGSSGR